MHSFLIRFLDSDAEATPQTSDGMGLVTGAQDVERLILVLARQPNNRETGVRAVAVTSPRFKVEARGGSFVKKLQG